MTPTTVPQVQLRAAFAQRLAAMYGREVPLYTTLVEVAGEVNAACAASAGWAQRHGGAERLGSLERVTAERHGAIRLGSPREMAQAARVFAGLGMHPVGFYDLRDASAASVPVVSTAFRPTDPAQLAQNPFRVFTSMLVTEDRRFFDAATQARLEELVAARELFGPRLLQLADQAAARGALGREDAEELLDLATAAFELSEEPIDEAWYDHLAAISAVAADIGGVASTHINHLTPRVLDIDDLYARMQARGITMIDEVQGPPAWEGPDVLLRQTSFRALAEERVFARADGTVGPGSLRVRFGEVEQRGIALTPAGREVYDAMVAQVDEALAGGDARTRVQVSQEVWREHLPTTEAALAQRGLAFFTYRVPDGADASQAPLPTWEDLPGAEDLARMLAAGVLVAEPIVYEDFLPRSAAGIFASNLDAPDAPDGPEALDGAGTRDGDQAGAAYDLGRLSEVVGVSIADPMDLYAAQQERSVRECMGRLGLAVLG